ncbi:MAG TPA: type I glyceraldehyde-3-phosphate dehydrogenase [Symbiobacteriaceae bacterium]|nr:type I glyceraldehyde-3-phosphate dehydrogenase [Symbiobacteriaceae bacterium]
MKANLAINGFGRIGRMVCRRAIENPFLTLVAINASYDAPTLAHLLRYDTTHGRFTGTIETEEDALIINGQRVQLVHERDASRLPWHKLGVDIVVEATGKYKERAKAALHLASGAKKVIITTASKDADVTVVAGVNEEAYDPARHDVIAAASCTTNCLAPIAKLLHRRYGILSGLMTTVHAYTSDQNILDNPHKDLRRARGAAQSIIPTTTGAAKAVAQVLPELAGKLNGFALRVPTPDVSVVDLVARLEQPVTVAELNALFREAAEGAYHGILGFSDEPLVSSDYCGDDRSSIVDGTCTMVGPDNMVKVVAWYDNEWGYSCRVTDVAAFVARAMVAGDSARLMEAAD